MNQLPLELIGAALALAFLVLVGLRRWWAWPAYIASSLVYLPVFWESKLYYDALLQLFFVGMGVYGWRSWSLQGEVIEPISWGAAKHGRVLAMWLTASALMGLCLMLTDAGAYAFLDAFITVGSVLATVITVQRVLENWWYWLAINIVSAGTYGLKGLWVTTGLMAIYAVMSLWGLWEWRRAARVVE